MLGYSVIFLGAVMVGVTLVQGSPFAVDGLTKEQRMAVGELRDMVKDDLVHQYQWEDAYLTKWLVEKNFNVGEAAQLLRQNLQWRREEKIDSILEEDWRDMNDRFPYSLDKTDKSGRPLLYYDIGEWDIARFLTAGGDAAYNRLARYFVKLNEESDSRVRQLRSEGSNVTQFNVLINLAGLSTEKHACLSCVYLYRHQSLEMPNRYPHSSEKNVFVNVPMFYRMIHSFLGDANQKSITLYGQDQGQWEPVLLDLLERDQVPGGLLSGGLPDKDNSEGLLQWNVKEL